MGKNNIFFKKIIKNKINWIAFVLMVTVLCIVAYMNARTVNHYKLERQLTEHIDQTEQVISDDNSRVENMDPNTDEYKYAKIGQEFILNRHEVNKKILSFLKEKNWKEAYKLQAQIEDENYEMETNGNSYISKEAIIAIDRQSKLYHELSRLNIEEHYSDFPTYGLDMMIGSATYLVPLIFVLCLIFVLSQSFCDRYKNRIDIVNLLPYSRLKYSYYSIFNGFGYALLTLFAFLTVSFLLGFFISGAGTFEYPHLCFSAEEQVYYFKPIGDVIIPSMILVVLSIFAVVQTIYLISGIFMNKLSTLFISILVIFGFLFGINSIQPIQMVAHLIPFTYLRGFEVYSGMLNKIWEKGNLNFDTGIRVLIVSIAVLSILILILEKSKDVRLKKLG